MSSRRVQGRGQESLREGLSDFPRSLSHQSQNLGLTLDFRVEAACLGPSPSQVENLQALRKRSQPDAGRTLAGGGGGAPLDRAVARPWYRVAKPCGDLGTVQVIGALKIQAFPQCLRSMTLSPPTHLGLSVHNLVGGGTHCFAPNVHICALGH